MIRRGEIRPVKVNQPLVVVCGECPAEIYLGTEVPGVIIALDKLGWKYTRESGWVCRQCKPQRRLRYDESPRKEQP